MNEAEQARVVIILQEQMRDQREWRKDVDRQLSQIAALPYRMDALAGDVTDLKTSLTAFIGRIDSDAKERGATKEQREGIRLAQGLSIIGGCGVAFAIVNALFMVIGKVVH